MEGRAEFRSLATLMFGRASADTEGAVGASLDERVQMSIELCEHGEEVIAFENLVDNLHEFAVPISADECALLQQLARKWSVPDARPALLRDLVQESR